MGEELRTDGSVLRNGRREDSAMTNMLFECFLAAAETLNFTTAAQKVHITQPAFSRNIAAFEGELGFPLFMRSKKNGVRLTQAGVTMYTGLKKLGEEYAQLLEQTERANRCEEGKLVVGLLNGVHISSGVSRLLGDFQARYPQVEVIFKSFNYGELLSSVESGGCDVTFTFRDALKTRPDLLCNFFQTVESYLAVPAGPDFDRTGAYRLRDFKDRVFLLSEDAPEINEMFVEACRADGFEPRTKMAPDFETKMLWVELGLGVAGHGKDHYSNQSPQVVFLRVEGLRDLEYVMVWQKENYNPAIALLYSMFS